MNYLALQRVTHMRGKSVIIHFRVKRYACYSVCWRHTLQHSSKRTATLFNTHCNTFQHTLQHKIRVNEFSQTSLSYEWHVAGRVALCCIACCRVRGSVLQCVLQSVSVSYTVCCRVCHSVLQCVSKSVAVFIDNWARRSSSIRRFQQSIGLFRRSL